MIDGGVLFPTFEVSVPEYLAMGAAEIAEIDRTLKRVPGLRITMVDRMTPVYRRTIRGGEEAFTVSHEVPVRFMIFEALASITTFGKKTRNARPEPDTWVQWSASPWR